MNPPVTPTGHREFRAGLSYLVLRRTYAAPIDAVWASLTESERLGRWFGIWSGDPQAGFVMVQMVAEGDGPPSRFDIEECRPPVRLVVSAQSPDAGGDPWRIELDLAEQDGVTTLTFAQPMDDQAFAGDVGPGWDYYLDRLGVSLDDGDVAGVDWDSYHPALTEHYRSEFNGPGTTSE